MKNCEEVLELLSLYIDKELDDVTVKAVEEHIESCSSCKAELCQLIEIVKMCNDIDEVELPDNFKESLHQKLVLEQENMIIKMQENKKTIRKMMKTVASVAAMFILVFAAYGLMNTGAFKALLGFNSKEAPPDMSALNSISQENDGLNENKALKSDLSKEQTYAYDAEIGANLDNNTGDVYSFNMNPDNNDISITSVPADGRYPDSTPTDNKVTVIFSEEVNKKDGDYSIANQPDEIIAQPVINLTAYSNNFELDISYINKVAGKYGTKIEQNNLDSFNSLTAKGENMEFTIAGEPDYSVSYTMDKSSYDKFIKEINEKFKGKYNVTNDEKALSDKLNKVDKRIKELENSKETGTDEYSNLIFEKEAILNRLDSIHSNDKVTIGISVVHKQ